MPKFLVPYTYKVSGMFEIETDTKAAASDLAWDEEFTGREEYIEDSFEVIEDQIEEVGD